LSVGTTRDHVPPAPPELPADAHKGIAGRVLLAVGSEWMPGAAILTARAAQRAGAGLVGVIATEDDVPATLPIAVPEAVLVPWDDVDFDVERWHACLVGPGLGLEDSEDTVEWLISEASIRWSSTPTP
jgi:NAD(P)H-hydrate epimerase